MKKPELGIVRRLAWATAAGILVAACSQDTKPKAAEEPSYLHEPVSPPSRRGAYSAHYMCYAVLNSLHDTPELQDVLPTSFMPCFTNTGLDGSDLCSGTNANLSPVVYVSTKGLTAYGCHA